VLILGEAGIGKSSLVRALRGLLPAIGRLLVGQCDDLGTPRTLGPFRDLVASVGTESSNLSVVERQLGNLARAEELATEALVIEERRGDEWAIPYRLNGLAAIAVETGEFERAAMLLGAAAAMVRRQGNAWPPDEAPHFERSRAAVTAALDPGQLERAWSAGEGMPLAHAVRYALAPRPDLVPGHDEARAAG
jgi:energy-coupling factor transporter ATP-binding protein EcfA2